MFKVLKKDKVNVWSLFEVINKDGRRTSVTLRNHHDIFGTKYLRVD